MVKVQDVSDIDKLIEDTKYAILEDLEFVIEIAGKAHQIIAKRES